MTFVADYRPYAPLRQGHDGVRAMVEGAIAAFPDYHEELLSVSAEDAIVAVHLRITGTQLGRWDRSRRPVGDSRSRRCCG